MDGAGRARGAGELRGALLAEDARWECQIISVSLIAVS